ncbi:uncharacterized protein LOC105834636 [Monomorium pharaonis]|uniref:uncharacterized protein LOC105834636 n=1 Tax=Monomorium pharaonis TaxID=307658 RepID=UPI00063F55E9|nr:uncharacterized protein LOC105834636 [Monomorium pharaonis]XP_012532728.1 uncharacterized protein LOC105834636 [Monomorium pharaonis]XP_012532729.1 uncharacterized protein LOC105834636 [Monomorium pharaonis]XP_028046167.1 uncharacterized protein LOC105834636 [Monomorium pharaonis]XP_028046168.1 uncharacterized protein LOC105834636 [Monomorium pharaonis]XP_036138481.1 uncharacterized protein LOC105834636 [Monomorium pharaonis]XP_036138482.1 uncharacterized protein LOC105834636 [Monomorium p
MMWNAKWSHFSECFCRRSSLVLVLLPCLIFVTNYLVSNDEYEYDVLQYPSFKSYNIVEGMVDGYLVWNPKCHMLSKKPLDPSITKFVRKEKLEKCPNDRVLSQILREPNGSVFLFLDSAIKTLHSNVTCCWSSVVRPKVDKPKKNNYDSIITVKQCENLTGQVMLPREVEVAYVSCKAKTKSKPKAKTKNTKFSINTVYENVHAILNPEKVRERIDNGSQSGNFSRKLSVLVLGIDSVSRLNFYRAMPKTESYLRETGWICLKGYNKIGDNTFPNLMAILTGQTPQQAYSRCKPTVAYKLDNCPFLWHNFRNAGYVTAYGEDETTLNTFNYLKVGFVEPPTDYYLRPYMLASEKLLKIKKRFNMKYCTGPELSFERIFNYAINFAQTFISVPYFGFFWTNTISHDNMNGISSMDTRVLKKFMFLEQEGILNDSMVIFLSDHGMRWGEFRNTFAGWYEERLPYIYIWLPEWFRQENPETYRALAVNQNRLTSPFDLYEMLRDVLISGGGDADPSSGCSTCQSLFTPVPRERGCQDAGVAHHWCTCTAFKSINVNDKIAIGGVQKFLDHVESIVKSYKDKKGRRLCARLKLKKVHRVDQVIEFGMNNSSSVAYFYMIQTVPGNGNFEVTIRYFGDGNYTLSDSEVSRINPYATSARCLNRGMKQYCHCIK